MCDHSYTKRNFTQECTYLNPDTNDPLQWHGVARR
jgi:hypothetical protein